jgi:hypothetical protein
MKKLHPEPVIDARAFPPLPGWMVSAPAETLKDAPFRSGAALAHLHLVAADPVLPQALWRARLALSAAEVCVALAGRRETAGALRDALHLTRPGDHPGPAGEVFRRWTRAVARPISGTNLHKAIPDLTVEQIAICLDAGSGNPVDRAAAVLEVVLRDAPRAEAAALILADAALAQAMGWDHVLPLLATGLKPRDLRKRDDALRLACHRALVIAAGQAVALAADLARRAGRLHAVAPKLRAKGAEQAVALFLTRDALAPAALAAFMSDRAARRLCDRLVELGAVRELTGRDSFRLYGV